MRKLLLFLCMFVIAGMIFLAYITTHFNVGNPLLGGWLYATIGLAAFGIAKTKSKKSKLDFFAWFMSIFSFASMCRFAYVVYILINHANNI